MEYLYTAIFRVYVPLLFALLVSKVTGLHGKTVGTRDHGTGEDYVSRLKENIFRIGEKRTSVPTSSYLEIDEIFQEYSLRDNCTKPQDCSEVKCCGNWRSGIYKIYQHGVGDGYYIYCDLHGDQHGWAVIQRRQDGSVHFYRNWSDYETGFGQLNGEFWLGLSKIHDLLSQRPYQLQIKMRNFTGGYAYANYDWIFVSGPADQYRLQIGRYSGTAGDSLAYQNGMKFSTKDQDNEDDNRHCAVKYKGAWWYNKCYHSNLNGLYCGVTDKDSIDPNCVIWFKWNNRKPLQYEEMLVRPVTGHSACPTRD